MQTAKDLYSRSMPDHEHMHLCKVEGKLKGHRGTLLVHSLIKLRLKVRYHAKRFSEMTDPVAEVAVQSLRSMK